MHAVVVRVTINDVEPALEFLRNQIVPRVSQSPGFVNGYWTSTEDRSNGLSMLVFESEDSAKAAAADIQDPPTDAVNLEGVEVREVVESA